MTLLLFLFHCLHLEAVVNIKKHAFQDISNNVTLTFAGHSDHNEHITQRFPTLFISDVETDQVPSGVSLSSCGNSPNPSSVKYSLLSTPQQVASHSLWTHPKISVRNRVPSKQLVRNRQLCCSVVCIIV